ncbi:AraC family transcriptional regulator [Niallia circulans]|uniref:bifunctional transcriptional activator/DNA repair enzyme AdaA n=1 Tax=Niallia circulans TaxID=1397 RepID=UPI000F4539FD|nr:Ada metal-binding domain-containing protein [Niallia circulans]AYV66154.1 AraC family transcriptional regulator [Niallia circulans]
MSTCNNYYDGMFYYVVITTGIFCRPSCKAKTPLQKNIIFFDSIKDALKNGFRPCKMCRPDLSETIYDPNKDLVERVKELISNNYSKSFETKKIAPMLGVSNNHLVRLFKQYYGKTISEYLIELRLKEATRLLTRTDTEITKVAFEAGFQSMSNFYKIFKTRTGLTPKEYRMKCLYGSYSI